jgi:hypothetical protein
MVGGGGGGRGVAFDKSLCSSILTLPPQLRQDEYKHLSLHRCQCVETSVFYNLIPIH